MSVHTPARTARIVDWRPWASVTFTGARVKVHVNFAVDLDADLAVPGALVADLALLECGQIEVLLLDDSDRVSQQEHGEALVAAILTQSGGAS